MKKKLDAINKILHYNAVVKKISGKSKLLDLFFSRLLLQVPYDSYVDFCFYNKSWSCRKNFLYNEWKYYVKYNPGVTRDNHDDKGDLMDKILPFMKRKTLKTKGLTLDSFNVFIEGLPSFFYKPLDGDSGVGVEKIAVEGNIDKLYSDIIQKPFGILEETVVQHDGMNLMNPNLVQTIRFFVCKKKTGAEVLFAAMRTSLKANVCVDNAGAGGSFAGVDLQTGKICTNGFSEVDSLKGRYDVSLINEYGVEKHPVTGTTFKGFEIPFFQEARELVVDIANHIDFYGRKLLGFDIAISKNGPVVIEVNANRPGISDLWQIPLKNTPLRPLFENHLSEI